MTPAPELLTVTQAAQYLTDRGLRVAPRTVQNWAAAGRLRYVRVPSRRRYFSPVDLDALLAPVPITAA